MPLARPDSHDDHENEHYWRDGAWSPNRLEAGVEPSKSLDYDLDAIHVMGDVELEQLPEAVNREIVRNSEEIVYEDGEEERILEREGRLIELDGGSGNVPRNARSQSHEAAGRYRALVRARENVSDIGHEVERGKARRTRRIREGTCETLSDEKFVRESAFAHSREPARERERERCCPKANFNRSLSAGDPFVTDGRWCSSFRETRREDAINDVRNIAKAMTEQGPPFKKIGRYYSDLPSNGDPMRPRQRPNDDFPEWENRLGSRAKITEKSSREKHDDVRFEDERIARRAPSNRPAKIAIQRRLCANDAVRSPVSPESGFCESGLDIKPRKLAHPFVIASEGTIIAVPNGGNNGSSESIPSRENATGDFDSLVVPAQRVVETAISLNDNAL